MSIFNLTKTPFGVFLFTIIESVILAVWLNLALAHRGIESFLALALGLYLEHAVAYNVGKT